MSHLKITPELVRLAYKQCRKVAAGKLTKKQARDILTKDGRMKPTTANDFIYNFQHLLEGKRYTRTFNQYSIEYFVKNIRKDYPREFKNALYALSQHIHYYESVSKQKSKMVGTRIILQKYEELAKIKTDHIEENNIEELISPIKDRNELIALLQARPSERGEIEINNKIYRRDALSIQILKKLRNYKCQICGKAIKMANGNLYVEGAHIKPKSKSGFEKPNNILILCPNHHKEFDFGVRRIHQHDYEIVKFELNGAVHEISLKL